MHTLTILLLLKKKIKYFFYKRKFFSLGYFSSMYLLYLFNYIIEEGYPTTLIKNIKKKNKLLLIKIH